jgi:hypothetical protein
LTFATSKSGTPKTKYVWVRKLIEEGKAIARQESAKRTAPELTDAQLDAASARGEMLRKTEPRAQTARFDKETHRVVVTFTNGSEFVFPPELADCLAGASENQLANIRVIGQGVGLHWEDLDADLSVPRLAEQIFGTRSHMARLGGQATSHAKAAAARENGAKGGRPKRPMHAEQ